MPEARTSPNKYVFLDVVGFTHKRSVESQSDIVHALNEIVKEVVATIEIPNEKIIYLPTGDGICIVILNIEAIPDFPSPYDVHLRIALSLIELINENDKKVEDELRKFKVRVGINENTDNIVTDINGRLNVAGDGINTAQRLMSLADGNQVLVSETVFTKLRTREKYLNSAFRKLPMTKIKHGLEIVPYQFIGEAHAGLETNMPERYQTSKNVEPKLTKFAAYYLAHAIKNRSFLLRHKGVTGDTPSHILLGFLAKDSEKESNAKEIDTIYFDTYKAEEGNREVQFNYYSGLPFAIQTVVEDYFRMEYLADYSSYFDAQEYRFVNSRGITKLKAEWQDIWDQFELDGIT